MDSDKSNEKTSINSINTAQQQKHKVTQVKAFQFFLAYKKYRKNMYVQNYLFSIKDGGVFNMQMKKNYV